LLPQYCKLEVGGIYIYMHVLVYVKQKENFIKNKTEMSLEPLQKEKTRCGSSTNECDDGYVQTGDEWTCPSIQQRHKLDMSILLQKGKIKKIFIKEKEKKTCIP